MQFSQALDHALRAVQEQSERLGRITRPLLALTNENSNSIEQRSEQIQQIVEFAGGLSENQAVLEGVIKELSEFSEYTHGELSSVSAAVEQDMQAILRIRENTRDLDAVQEFVTEVADKTNLLGINASIEAARAGVAGRGFSVVAQEINRLSQFNKNQGDSLGKIVSKSMTLTEEITHRVSNTHERVDNQVVSIRQLGEALDRLVGISGSHHMFLDRLKQIVNDLRRDMHDGESEDGQELELAAGSVEEIALRLREEMDQLRSHANDLQEYAAELATMAQASG